jgi:hypothetical protein
VSIVESYLHLGHSLAEGERLERGAELCEALVEAGAEAECCEKLLEQCAKDGHLGTVKRLVKRGICLGQVPLIKNVEAIQLLLDHGSKMDSRGFRSMLSAKETSS